MQYHVILLYEKQFIVTHILVLDITVIVKQGLYAPGSVSVLV